MNKDELFIATQTTLQSYKKIMKDQQKLLKQEQEKQLERSRN
jgi:hypothetical protein